jgi:hypothetical protein
MAGEAPGGARFFAIRNAASRLLRRGGGTHFPRQQLTGFGFDVELLFIAQCHGLAAVEVPVRWIDSPASRVSPLRDARRMFGELLKIRRLARRGAYRVREDER